MAYTINTGPLGSTFSNVTLNGSSSSYSINPVITMSTGTSPYTWTTTGISDTRSSIQVKGDAEFDGNVTVQGKNLMDMLETIESRLGILTPNPALEAEFDELKALGDAYREAERRLNEQKRVFEILKTQDK